MKKPAHHIFVCGSFRATGSAQGVCSKKNSMGLLQYLEQELADRGLPEIAISSTGCLKACDHGPVVIIYPENWWFGGVEDEAAIDAIIDGLESGQPAEAYLID
ncbi:MAG: (2Fe-2S) ferredoxin domain-containing protein [Deltaproteobacteria bacterium]|nr:(2Fe-2S) ferredoxin domain-containing protein [Deltaproteobacteria bacterium]